MNTEDLLEQYSCGPVKFSGRDDALYERHLMFDQVAPTTNATAREQFEAAARSARDVLSQRWIRPSKHTKSATPSAFITFQWNT